MVSHFWGSFGSGNQKSEVGKMNDSNDEAEDSSLRPATFDDASLKRKQQLSILP